MLADSLFTQWGLSEDTLLSIGDLGFANPTPVQSACIPHLLKNDCDLLALAKTGTGKTAAFGIPLIEKIKPQAGLQALVLCPTRELAQQVAQSLSSMGVRKGLKVTTVLGGESYRKQIDSLRRNPEILVSTPGRLIDLMEQKIVRLLGVRYLILDEADEMLSFGFQEALETIWEDMRGQTVNTWLFSATMSDSIRRLTSQYLNSPYEVTLNTSSEQVRVQSFAAVVYEEDKQDALCLLLKNTPEFYGIIFAQTKKQVSELEIKLRAMGLAVDSLHGDKVQADRTRVIARMKRKEAQILVATDVAARGLDIEDLTHVVNFEIPWDVETYTHRIGRTARAGKTGIVWTMVKPKEAHQLRKFERALKSEFKPLTMPSVKDVRKVQIRNWLKAVNETQISERDQEFYQEVTLDLQVEDQFLLSPSAREWIFKALHFAKVGADFEGRQPRSFELRPRDNSQGARAHGDSPRRHSGVQHSRRNRYPAGGEGEGRRERFESRGGDRSESRPQARSTERFEGRSDRYERGPARDENRGEYRSERGPRSESRYERPSTERRFEGRAERSPEGRSYRAGSRSTDSRPRFARNSESSSAPSRRSYSRAER